MTEGPRPEPVEGLRPEPVGGLRPELVEGLRPEFVEGRIAVRFRRGEAVTDVDHLQTLRIWEEVLEHSGLPLARTEGGRPRPRFALAAPLPLGYTSEAEWIELHLIEAEDRPAPSADPRAATRPGPDLSSGSVLAALNDRLPEGLQALETRRIEPGAPSLQAQLRWAEYRMLMPPGQTPDQLERAIDAFFSREAFPWEETIEGKRKWFDLKSLVDDAWIEQSEGGVALGLRLDASTTGTGRPDSVLAGLGLAEPRAKQRTRLLFSYLPEASLLWRRQGRFQPDNRER